MITFPSRKKLSEFRYLIRNSLGRKPLNKAQADILRLYHAQKTKNLIATDKSLCSQACKIKGQ